MLPISHLLLIAACVFLLGTIAFQDYSVTALRNETVSSGLTGPLHWLLDASYVPIAVMLPVVFATSFLPFALALISSIALLLVASTNTFHVWWDAETGGNHARWHSRFTLVVFIASIVLQVVADFQHPAMSALTVFSVIVPSAVYVYFHLESTDIDGTVVAASPAAEKALITFLCLYYIVWCL